MRAPAKTAPPVQTAWPRHPPRMTPTWNQGQDKKDVHVEYIRASQPSHFDVKYQYAHQLIKMALYCPQGSGTLRQQLSMMHGIAWYYMVLHGVAKYCMVLHGIAW